MNCGEKCFWTRSYNHNNNADYNRGWLCLYKIVRDMVPAINADEVFIPIRNKRQIRAKTHQDCYSTNFVNIYNLNNSDCYKVPASKTDQFKNSFFVQTTSDWNSLLDIHTRAEIVNSFKTDVHTYVTSQLVRTPAVKVPELVLPLNRYRFPLVRCRMIACRSSHLLLELVAL